MEIERKFLVKKMPNLTNIVRVNIIQGYINYEPEVRIRKKDNRFYLTRKSLGTIERSEEDTEISEAAYNILSSLVKSDLKKVRYLIPIKDNLTAELDIYQGKLKGLNIVEVEFTNEKEANMFKVPDWFGKEITEDNYYKNQNLSKLNKIF